MEVGGVEKKGQDEPKQEEIEALETLKIHLAQGGRNEIRDFQLKRSSLKKIEYFEDLLIEEADRLVLARDFARAFECCLRVRSRNPGWAGLDDCVNRVLFAEGRRALMDGDDERGLRLLRELLGRKRDYPGLLDQIAEAYGKRIDRAVRLGLYVRGRRVLHELVEVTGELSAVRALRSLFITRATERMKQGESASPSDRLDALVDALRIWPTLPGAEEQYVKAFEAEPTLDVGVTDVAVAAGPLGPLASRRAGQSPAVPAAAGVGRRGGPAGQAAWSARGVGGDVGPGSTADDPPPPGSDVVRRLPAGVNHRPGPRADRAERPQFAQLRGTVGRPARSGARCATTRVSRSGSTIPP